LRTNDMFGGRLQLIGETAMGNQNDAYHGLKETPGPRMPKSVRARLRAAHYIVLFAMRLNA